MKLPVLAKYVRSHYKAKIIISDTKSSVMKIRRLKANTCLLFEFEPKTLKDDLDNEDWI